MIPQDRIELLSFANHFVLYVAVFKLILQTVQNGTPFMNNKRTYAFSPDMDATNNGNVIPMNKKQNMYGVSFQQNKSYASKN